MERALPHIQDRLIEAVARGEFRRTPHGPLRRVSSRIIVTLHLDEFRRGAGSNLTTSMRDFLRRLPKLVLPPLRERPQDIPLLAAHYRKRVLGMSKPALPPDDSLLSPDFLKNYPWRENVTELKACLRGACILTHVDLLQRPARLELEKMFMLIEEGGDLAMRDSVEVIQNSVLQRVLKICGGHKARAARTLGLSDTNFRLRNRLMQS
jgi:two-component system response regulator AtoC